MRLKRLISGLLVLCMVFAMIPAVSAAETGSLGNRILLDETIFAAGGTVWVDGIACTVQEDSAGCYALLPEGASGSSMVVCTQHIGDAQDIHTQYPTDMQFWALNANDDGSYTPTHVEALDNILQYSGMSIRITGVKGIRMITSIEQEKKNALISADGLEGYKLKEYGTVLAWSEALEGGNPLILGPEYARSNYAYKKGVADPIFQTSGSLMQYTNVLVGFTLDECSDDIAMRPYMILETPDGEEITIYGGIVHRSIGYIAWQNRYVFAPGSAAYAYVWEIIRHVYGDISEVIFQPNGGSAVEPVIVENGTVLAKPADPTNGELFFAGWYTDVSLTKKYDFSAVVTDNLTLYAKWTERPVMPENPSEADVYYFGNTEVIDIVDAPTSQDIPTGADVHALLAERGFTGFPVIGDYTLSGTYTNEAEVPAGSANRFPMYETYYISSSGEVWVIYVINGQVMANPASFNVEGIVDGQVLFSEDGTLTSYDAETGKFYVTIPHTGAIMKTVDRIDAATLDTLTIEEIKKLW